jgi:hypothetical protein
MFTVYVNGRARSRKASMGLAINSARVAEGMGAPRRLISIGTPEGYVMPLSEILFGRS